MKYDVSKIRFGSKIKYKGNLYFVDEIGKRVIRARKIFDIDPKFNPYGTVSNVLTSIKIKDIVK